MLLDDAGVERGDRLSDFIQQWDIAAACNDMELLHEAIAIAREQNKVVRMGDRRTNKAEQWYQDDLAIIQQGWTGPGQTNELLKVFARFGIVWQGLDGDDLVDYIIETAQTAPGYQDYCNHKHELDQRAAEWAAEAQGYYTPYCSFPTRTTNLHKHECSQDSDQNVLPFNDQRAEESRQRIRDAVATLEANGTFPPGIEARANLLSQEAQCSRRTLYKNLNLWHPHHYEPASVNHQGDAQQDGTAEQEKISADPLSVAQPPENQSKPDPVEDTEESVPTPPIRSWGTATDFLSSRSQSLTAAPPRRLPSTDYSPAKSFEYLDLSGAIAAIQISQRLLKWTTQQLQEWLFSTFSVRSLSFLDEEQLVLCAETLSSLSSDELR
jgi:hypothetical protein